MKLVVDMEKECFINAIKYDDVKEAIEFYLSQEYEYVMSINDFLEMNKDNDIIEIYDSIEFDVEKDFARLLIKYNIPYYSIFVLIDEDNEIDDINSINEAKDIFNLDIYSEYQGAWV